MTNKFPRVLIIGYFDQSKPVGITTKSMFSKWPKDKLAIASFGKIEQIYSKICNKYYCLGNKEIEYIFPINKLFKINSSQSYDIDFVDLKKKLHISALVRNHSKIKSLLHIIINFILIKMGLFLIKYKYRISDSFNNWIKEFDPDIVYCTVEDINRMRFVIDLKKKNNYRLAIHIMDDWIHSIHKYTFLPFYWSKKLVQEFRKLLSISNVNIAISEKMAQEYKEKYNTEFNYLHNTVDLSCWLNIKPQNISNNFLIIYAGKIGKDHIKPIKDFIYELEKINRNDEIVFKIFSTTKYSVVYRFLKEKTDKYFFGSVYYKEIPALFKSADGLFLPLSFDKKSLQYTRLSMPTKLTEYMISQTPIFCYAPKETAVSEYLIKNQCAIIVNDRVKLKSELKKFIKNNELRIKISKKAFEIAYNEHDIDSNTEKLREMLIK